MQSYLNKIFKSVQSGQDHLLYLKKSKLMQRWNQDNIKLLAKSPNICT